MKYLLLVSLCLISGCGDPTQVEDPIEVTAPDTDDVWQHYETGYTINWSGGNSEDVLIELLYEDVLEDTIALSAPNTGSYLFNGYVSPAWGTGSNFSIRITDRVGVEGTSEQFSVQEVSDQEVFNITEPSTGTVWNWHSHNATIEWVTSSSSILNKHRSGTQYMNGDEGDVRIELWNNSVKVDNISDWVANSGNYTYPDSVPVSWGKGEDYTVRISDINGNYGLSPEFTISDVSFSIDVTEPISGTVWYTGQTGTHVAWGETPGSSVRIEIWNAGYFVYDFSDWIPNIGSFYRPAPIPGNWGQGEDYRLKVIDDEGYTGWSDYFTLRDSVPVGMEFATIPSGSFEMGAPETELGSGPDERPLHTVNINYSFEIMTTEVTQGMWEQVMGYNPSSYYGIGEDYPVYFVSWEDCQEFIDAMNSTCPYFTYRLPSEAEWEYSCRAGTSTRFYWGDDPDETMIDDFAWWNGNSGGSTHPVGEKEPNAWGLYDMSGNVDEWCQDWYHTSYTGAPGDGSAWVNPPGSKRVLRGGSWYQYSPTSFRSASRASLDPGLSNYGLGLRLVRMPR